MRHAQPLKFLMPGWFSVVMGLTGLALAWRSAEGALGESAMGVALVLGAVAWVVCLVLLALSAVRASRYNAALAEDLRHPVRHAFVAALPVSLLLLAALATTLGQTGVLTESVWWLGALGQLAATVWVLKRWLVPTPVAVAPVVPAGLQGLIDGALVAPAKPAVSAALVAFWPVVTPVLLIPVVGNVVAPLAGLALGHGVWSMAQFGIGVLLWPVVITLLLVRRAAQGALPDRLLPTWFITIAPPSVVGLVGVQSQAGVAWVAGAWGVALFFVLLAATVARQAIAQPFSLTFWAMSFPLAAFTSLTLKLAQLAQSSALQMAGTLMLALVSLVVFGLSLATVRGLREGSLLAPEPIAAILPAT
ncbi:MAG: C4-dicarboxylate ABC transporter [Burkholderiales bacterium]|nr:C4-dicarboxylate ABC transporter [Burkholderiales bacterium]